MGSDATSCGLGGGQCVACVSGSTCQAGLCLDPSTGGGTATGGGGGSTGGGGGTSTGGGSATGGGTSTGGGSATGGGGAATGGGTATGGGGGTSITVTGHVKYDFVPAVFDVANQVGTLDFAQTVQRPVRSGKVVVLEGTRVLGTAFTAVDGAYNVTFVPTGTGALSVVAMAVSQNPTITVKDNTSQGAIWSISAPVSVAGGTVELHATSGWTGRGYSGVRTAAPFAILDSMFTAATAALVARPALQFPALSVNWSPNNTTDTNGSVEDGYLGSSYFDFELNEIFVLGKAGVDTDEYDNHVIVHEWGHYFEHNLARSDSMGGSHGTGDVLDPRDAFSEGWGDAASAIFLEDSIYADTSWTGSSIEAFGWDMETDSTPPDDPNPGPFSESSVMRIIYDAWDTANEVSFDRLALGTGGIIDTLVAHRTTDAFITIGSFATALKARASVNAADVDALLAGYQVGAITTAFGDGDTALRAIYVPVSTLPFMSTATLDGRVEYNFAAQNVFYVFTGNGNRITVTANCSRDVGIAAYRRGVEVGSADALAGGGTESFNFNSTQGTIYVVNLTGYGSSNGTYTANVTVTSP